VRLMKFIQFAAYVFHNYYSKGPTATVAYLKTVVAMIFLVYLNFFSVVVITGGAEVVLGEGKLTHLRSYTVTAMFIIPLFLFLFVAVPEKKLKGATYNDHDIRRARRWLPSVIGLSFVFFVVSLIIRYQTSKSVSAPKDTDSLTTAAKQTANVDSARHAVGVDTTVNGILKLHDGQSVKHFYDNVNNIRMIDSLRSSPVAMFLNRNKTQYLKAYQYEGGTKNAFSLFEFGYVDSSIPLARAHMTAYDGFSTESGITLGSAFSGFLIAPDAPVAIDTTVRIRTSSHDFVLRHNMPAYEMQATFRSGKLVKLIYGFEYP
jgi:hypothetical protein